MLSGEQCWNGVVGTHNSPPPKKNKIKTPRVHPVLLPNGFFPPPRNLALSLTPPYPPPTSSPTCPTAALGVQLETDSEVRKRG